MNRSGFQALLAAVLLLHISCSEGERTSRRALAKQGGSPTVRVPYDPIEDDPFTTNDESNDQPLGHFGTITVEITSHSSGNTYTLDAEVVGTTLERVYFPKGGWVDFYSCEVGEDLYGDCEDEEGRWWILEGESSWGVTDAFVDDELDEYDVGAYEDRVDDYDEYEDLEYQDDDADDFLGGSNGNLGYDEDDAGYP